MLSLQFIRTHPDLVRRGAEIKGYPVPLDEILELDRQHRILLTRSETLKAERNAASNQLVHHKEPQLLARMKEISEQVKQMNQEIGGLSERLQDLLLQVPNLPHESVPVGLSAADNVEVRRWGQARRLEHAPRTHYEIGEMHDVLDFERAVKIAGSRFAVVKGWGARLERALIQFMLDLHVVEHGYVEVMPPLLVNRRSMVGTGNLPKFEDEAFHLAQRDLFLIPTAEVPLTNLHAGEILAKEQLPVRYVAYTPCFRSEAGAAGQDTRGYIRLHQFQKVEMVILSEPERSMEALETLVGHAEEVLKRLRLPYRVLLMCSGDMGFQQWKKYDIEVWCPGLDRYLEVSSCSNFGEYQARRAQLRYRPAHGAAPRYLHTLNGSGLASTRTFDAILENYQRVDGSVEVPEVLRPYLSGRELLGSPKP